MASNKHKYSTIAQTQTEAAPAAPAIVVNKGVDASTQTESIDPQAAPACGQLPKTKTIETARLSVPPENATSITRYARPTVLAVNVRVLSVGAKGVGVNATLTAKAISKAALKLLQSATDGGEARSLTAIIMSLYSGTHLYPLSAIATLASFPGHFEIALDHLFTVATKVSVRLGVKQRTFWESVKNKSGAAARCFKNIDQTLIKIICTEWVRRVKEGRETELKVIALYDRITAFWVHLMQTINMPKRTQGVGANLKYLRPFDFRTTEPRISRYSLNLLRHVEARRSACLKVNRIVGDVLPLELANFIKDYLYDGDSLLSASKRCGVDARNTLMTSAMVEGRRVLVTWNRPARQT